MKVSDEAIILATRTHTENSKIVKCLTKGHGIFSGFIKNSSNKLSKNTYIEGSLVNFYWSARLDEHVGTLKCELIKSYASNFLFDKQKAISISSLLQIIETTFPERDNIEGLFDIILTYIIFISSNQFSITKYIEIELRILELAGYGLKLDKCSQTGELENLCYVSPKTGRAICKRIGEEYEHKLLHLPNMDLLASSKKDQEKALNLTAYFFERYIYKNHRNKLPEIRKYMVS